VPVLNVVPDLPPPPPRRRTQEIEWTSEYEIDFLEAQLEESERRRHDLEARVAGLAEENDTLWSQVAEAVRDRDEARDNLNDLASELAAVEGLVSGRDLDLDLDMELQTAQQTIERLEQRCRMYVQRLTRTDLENETLRRAIGR
jgi:chromosome segregation ATPase